MNGINHCNLDNEGALQVIGDEKYWLPALSYNPDIVAIITQVQLWSQLSDEAKIVLDFCLYQRPCSKPGYRLEQVIRKTFVAKWGQAKVFSVWREVKIFLRKVLN